MIEGVREFAIDAGLIAAERFDEGIRDLQRTAEADGTFNYTFFKGVGMNGSPMTSCVASEPPAVTPMIVDLEVIEAIRGRIEFVGAVAR